MPNEETITELLSEAFIATVETVFHQLAEHSGERGDVEGAAATLARIIRERNAAIAANEMLLEEKEIAQLSD